jgi:predicted ribonuclease toxin of YeeF-YezG toxin-antitoxin module
VSKINIKVKQVEAANKDLVNLSYRIDRVGNQISSVRHQVDGRIASRRSIGRNLNEAAAKVSETEKKLKKIHHFVDVSMDLYEKADKKADRFKEPKKQSVWDKMKDMFGTANDIVSGFRKGLAEAAFSTFEGIWNAITHPIETAKGIVYAVSHPVETAKSIWESISDSWKNDVINGDAQSRSQWFGRAIGEVALAIIGTKGVDKAVKMAKGARVVEEAGGVRVVKPVTSGKVGGKVDIKEKNNNIITPKSPSIVNYGEHYTREGRKKVLKPDIEYTSKEGYNYRTDSQGRITSAEGTLNLGEGKRNYYTQKVVGREDRLPDDDGGHLIASIFKGSGDLDNLVPMNGNLNKGEWKKLENIWTNAIKEGDEVKVKITPNYLGDSQRPVSFSIKYKIGDDDWEIRRFDNARGGKLNE